MVEGAHGYSLVYAEIETRCRAIAAALADLGDLISSGPMACALDLHDTKVVTLYVVASEWLHVFRGPVDPAVPVQSREAINPRFPSSCEYRAVRITNEARFEYAFSGNTGPLSPTVPGVFTDVARTWTFHVADETVRLQISASDTDPIQSEQARFAEWLARIILAQPQTPVTAAIGPMSP